MSASRTYTAGNVLTAAQQNDLAQGTLGYAPVTTNQGSITTETDLTGLTVTVTLVAGRRIRITGSLALETTVANDSISFNIKEGATQLQKAWFRAVASGTAYSLEKSVVLTPTAGSHTYKLSAVRDAGTGTITMDAAATYPAFLLVEDIGI